MKLNSVRICNFRSIKDQTIRFTHNCMILVGENEAGKSNALKAIAGGLSQQAYPITVQDKRKTLAGETLPKKNDYFIQYHFTLQGDDMNQVLSKITKKPLGSLIKNKGKTLSLRQYCEDHLNQITYVFDLMNYQGKLYFDKEEKSGAAFTLTRPLFGLHDGSNLTDTQYKQGSLTDDAATYKDGTAKEISSADLYKIVTEEITQYFLENKTEVIFWNYSDAFILPDTIPLNLFRSSPDISIPLRNIFELAKITDVDKAFKEAEEMDGDYENLLERVSVIATRKFTKKWPGLKNAKILVSSDGDVLRIKMQEKAKYNFSERSDGFKRVVSILLMLSSQVETGKIANQLLVIDEPDNSLYPSASRYLRDELLQISERNLVLYSTHSPFMVDKENLDRHIIVSKSKDVTQLIEAKQSLYMQDEVLLHAVGTSLFESLKADNLFFEDWSDYCIFQAATAKKNTGHKDLHKKFNGVGTAYVHGSSSFRHVTPIVQLASKNVFIVSDSSKAAKAARSSYKRENGYQDENWFTLEDLGGSMDVTVEDYLYDSFLQLGLDEVLGHGKKQVQDKGTTPVMKFLHDLTKEQKDQLKVYYATNVKPSDIRPSYYDLLERLWDKIEGFTGRS